MFKVDFKPFGMAGSHNGLVINDTDIIFQLLKDGTVAHQLASLAALTDFLEKIRKAFKELHFILYDGNCFQLQIGTPESHYRVKIDLHKVEPEFPDLTLDTIETTGYLRAKTLAYLAKRPSLDRLVVHDPSYSLVSGNQFSRCPMPEEIATLQHCLRETRHIRLEGYLADLGCLQFVLPSLINLRIFTLHVVLFDRAKTELNASLPVLLSSLPPNLETLSIPWIPDEPLFPQTLYCTCERLISLKNLGLRSRREDLSPPTTNLLRRIITEFGVDVLEWDNLLDKDNIFSRSQGVKVMLTLLQRNSACDFLRVPLELRTLLVKVLFGDFPWSEYSANFEGDSPDDD